MNPEVGEYWRHVKTGSEYRILGFPLREADCEVLVLYENTDTFQQWVRPLSEFIEGRFVRVFV